MTRSGRTVRFVAYLALAGAVVLVDQWTKQVAFSHLSVRGPVEVLPFLQLVLVFNEGAAFGFLSDAGGWQRYFLSGLGALVSVLLVGLLWSNRYGNVLLLCALALILGGALGNLVDRVSHEYVIDFILLHYRHREFPVFNIADGAISVGALGMILDALGGAPKRPGR